MYRALLCSFLLMFAAASNLAEAKGKKGFHCEIKKKGKTVDDYDIGSRKACKKKGGKWVKDHDSGHDHGDSGEDHEHDEE